MGRRRWCRAWPRPDVRGGLSAEARAEGRTPAAALLALIPEPAAGADLGDGRVTPDMPASEGYRRRLARVVEEGYAVPFG
jgi:hypothetical protein